MSKGVFNRTNEHKRKIAEALSGEKNYWYGKHHSEATKKKISENKIGKSSERKGKTAEEIYGTIEAKKWREKISNSRKGKLVGENNPMKRADIKEKHKVSCILRSQNVEYLTKLSVSHTGKLKSKEQTEKQSKLMKEMYIQRPELRNIMTQKAHEKSISLVANGNHIFQRFHKMLKENPRMKDAFVAKYMKACRKKPNKKEQYLTELLKQLFPNEWKYVGDGEFVLGGKCPDFLNCNGQKKVIELFGDYWHSKNFAEKKGRHWESPENRIEHFKKYGFVCLVLWENELEKEDKLIERLKHFHENGQHPSVTQL